MKTPTPRKEMFTHLSFKSRIERITWNWFASTMSTGALASLLSQQPFTFPGLTIIGKVVFVIDFLMFVTLTFLIVCRFIMHPNALGKSLHHPTESFFFGSFWVSIALILNGIQAYGVPYSGPWLVKAVEVLFWIFVACALLVAVFQYHIIFDVEKLDIKNAMPAWILPAYPCLVTGPLAGVIVQDQPNESALRILIAGIAFQGLGWTMAFMMYSIYMSRLITGTMPHRPGMYVAVGPAAYTSAALVQLGNQAKTVIPPSTWASTLSTNAGDIFAALGLVSGIFLWLVAFWFFALSTVSVLRGIKRSSFTLNRWAFIFPNAGLAIALLQIATQLNSTGMKAIGAGLTIILCAMWIVIAVSHARALWRRDILAPWRVDDGVDEINKGTTQEERVRREEM